jgi:hypothetical protein
MIGVDFNLKLFFKWFKIRIQPISKILKFNSFHGLFWVHVILILGYSLYHVEVILLRILGYKLTFKHKGGYHNSL